MKKLLMILVFVVLLCTACYVAPGPHGGLVIVPPLPLVVDLHEPYYEHSGFHYHYRNDRWYYSQSRGGPWIDLPRDRYPREVRQRGY